MRPAWVYIMTNRPNGTLYTGVTTNLIQRVWQHREGTLEGFTEQRGLKRLVYHEEHAGVTEAIQREKKHQTLVPRLESPFDLGVQSRMDRSV